MENHSVIRIFCSKKNPSFIPYHVSDKMSITEVERQYNFWLHFFHEKWKRKFIPLPWKIRDFIFRNINKIDEFSNHFHNMNLKYVKKIKGFDPNIIFVEHMLAVGYSNSFIHIILSEEEDNNLGSPTHNVGDLETVLSTNAFYKQKGKSPSEKSAQYPVVTPKTTTSWSNAPTAHPTKKVTNNGSSGEGENNPPLGKIESSHKIPLRKKRNNVLQEEEYHRIKNDTNSFSLEDMELEVDIEKLFPTIDHPRNTTHQNSSLEIIENETFSEVEPLSFQSAVFDKESKKLIFEKGNVKNKKGKSRSEVDLKDFRPS
jgi:hypothetical protein